MATVLRIDNLHKRYGAIHAVNDLSLEVQAGEVYGILGPNGSGKTTTLGMILSIIKPDSGTYTWFPDEKGVWKGDYKRSNVGNVIDSSTASGRSREAQNTAARQRIGTLLETPNFYPYLDAVENLRITALIKRLPQTNFDDILQQVNLYERRNSPFSSYSLGMKQRLAIAAAMIGDPDILIFDEPTNGLDPQGIVEVRNLILAIARQGKTIIMASHILAEVERICTHVAIMKRGRLLSTGRVGSIMGEQTTVEIGADDMTALYGLLQSHTGVRSIERDGAIYLLQLTEGHEAKALNRQAHQQGILLTHLVTRSKSLEAEFLEITS